MADKTTATELVKSIFAIPDWYLLSEKEENKLMNYLCADDVRFTLNGTVL